MTIGHTRNQNTFHLRKEALGLPAEHSPSTHAHITQNTVKITVDPEASSLLTALHPSCSDSKEKFKRLFSITCRNF